jgi:hypothetical protein
MGEIGGAVYISCVDRKRKMGEEEERYSEDARGDRRC